MTSDDTSIFTTKDRGPVSPFARTMELPPSRSKSATAKQQPIDSILPSEIFSSCSTTTTHSIPKKNPVQAYLRIRPLPPTQISSSSYLKVLDDEHVSLIPPQDSYAYRKRQGVSDQYQFTKVFTDSTSQKQLFEETTLPLLQSFLNGNNALIFAYGVTNSGKTYTMLGNEADAGVVPRTLQYLFHTINGRLSHALLKPVMHGTVQAYELDPTSEMDNQHENRSILLSDGSPDYSLDNSSDDTVVLQVDNGFEYGIWVSFTEIYNEKVYDLLDSPGKKQTKRPSLPLKYEYRSGYKYVAGLKHVRVKTAKEAYTVIHKGQQNRVVFSTLMNQSSSRSHSIFTISLIRCPVDSENFVLEDPAYATLSKLSIVDLAGSERYRNTFNQGQRLKEAGNINKSLMALGQCMETLRLNQSKIESGRRPGVVPFRHSKLTELFKNTFEGDGKVAIVVNINPFDTGFDENSGVMKFAAIAKEVTTVQHQKHHKIPLSDISETAHRRPRRNTTDSKNELDPHNGVDSSGQQYDNAFVSNLLKEMDCLREKWLDAEKRYATLESDTRQVSLQTNVEVEKWKDMYMSLLKKQSQAIGTHIDHHLQEAENKDQDMDTTSQEDPNHLSLSSIEEQQRYLTTEIDKLELLSKDHAREKHKLLEKIAQMELDKHREQTTTALELQRSDSCATEKDSIGSDLMDGRYANFLELRKQLRRSVFKREELLEDAEGILNQIEQFDGVTFDLVKNTKMGKLLKLITQEEFKSDPYLVQQRALELFKRFARLPRSTIKQIHQHEQLDSKERQEHAEDSLMDESMNRLDDDDTDDGQRDSPMLSQTKASDLETPWYQGTLLNGDDHLLNILNKEKGTDDWGSDTSGACDSRKPPNRKRRRTLRPRRGSSPTLIGGL